MPNPVNTIHHGDALTILKTLTSESIHCCVTSPPYWGLRDYGVDAQLGLEPTPEAYINNMVQIFNEIRRLLRHDGTCWLNIGDSYYGGKGQSAHSDPERHIKRQEEGKTINKPHQEIGGKGITLPKDRAHEIIKPKDLCLIPFRLAIALQESGWYVRSDIIWAKPNPMPESVTDRPTKSHEYIFLLTKSPRYYYDAEAIREPVQAISLERAEYGWDCDRPSTKNISKNKDNGIHVEKMGTRFVNPAGRNKRTVWNIATQPYPGSHFATFPTELPELCIKAGTSQHGCCPQCNAPWRRITEPSERYKKHLGKSYIDHKENELVMGLKSARGRNKQNNYRDESGLTTAEYLTTAWHPTCECNNNALIPCTVLDPFMGSGTTAVVAKRMGRNYIGIELNQKYITGLIQPRLQSINPLLDPHA